MTKEDLDEFKNWFSLYYESFQSPIVAFQKNITLKAEHTSNVCRIITRIATEESLTHNDIMLAEAAALFHDIGRFPQYARYGTFRDAVSLNHGRLGADVLAQEAVLRNLSEEEQNLIMDSVRFHNAFAVPHLPSPKAIFFIQLVRDADKLDIWRIFLEFFESGDCRWLSEIGLILPDIPGYSEEVLLCLMQKRPVSLASLKTVNDLKLMQLSWIFDLNFKASFNLLIERDYIAGLTSFLPRTEEIKNVSSLLQGYATRKITHNSENQGA
jgi:hypothetical protein